MPIMLFLLFPRLCDLMYLHMWSAIYYLSYFEFPLNSNCKLPKMPKLSFDLSVNHFHRCDVIYIITNRENQQQRRPAVLCVCVCVCARRKSINRNEQKKKNVWKFIERYRNKIINKMSILLLNGIRREDFWRTFCACVRAVCVFRSTNSTWAVEWKFCVQGQQNDTAHSCKCVLCDAPYPLSLSTIRTLDMLLLGTFRHSLNCPGSRTICKHTYRVYMYMYVAQKYRLLKERARFFPFSWLAAKHSLCAVIIQIRRALVSSQHTKI